MTLRFILRASPGAAPDVDTLAGQLRAHGEIRVVDQTQRMLLVDATQGILTAALAGLSGWTLTPESTTPLPDTQPRIKRAASARRVRTG